MKYSLLTENDDAFVQKLMKVFAEAFEDNEAYQAKLPTKTYIKLLLQNPNNIVLVAVTEEEEEVVGGLVAYELQKFEQERSEVYLYDLAVSEQYRRQGIATKLIAVLKIISRERGAEVIFVQADNIDAPAVALYTKLASKIETDITHFDIDVT